MAILQLIQVLLRDLNLIYEIQTLTHQENPVISQVTYQMVVLTDNGLAKPKFAGHYSAALCRPSGLVIANSAGTQSPG